jgi:conjugative transfer pilus assembly protein TraH
MAPEIAVTIEWLQDQAQKLNALNINSCQAARSLVDGTVGRYMQADEERARNWRVTLGDFSDRIGSWVNTTTNAQIYDAQNRAKSSIPGIQPPAGQNFSNQIPLGNFTWKALSNPALGLDTLQKRQLMTLIGTAIYLPPASDQESPRLLVKPGHLKLADFIGKSATGEASLEFYRCLDGYGDDQCLQVDLDAPAIYPSFSSIVQERLRAIANNIIEQHHLEDPADPGRHDLRERHRPARLPDDVHRGLQLAPGDHRLPDRHLQGADRGEVRGGLHQARHRHATPGDNGARGQRNRV